MPDSSWFFVVFAGVLGLFGIGLIYFVGIGARAIFRKASAAAREAGHPASSANLRASLRMAIWALYFGEFYLFLYFVGRWLAWWALAPAALGLVIFVWSLLQADRLLTMSTRGVRQQVGVGLKLTAVFAGFGAAIWLAAHGN